MKLKWVIILLLVVILVVFFGCINSVYFVEEIVFYWIFKFYGLWEKFFESVRYYIEFGLEGKVEEILKEDFLNVYNFFIVSNVLVCEVV